MKESHIAQVGLKTLCRQLALNSFFLLPPSQSWDYRISISQSLSCLLITSFLRVRWRRFSPFVWCQLACGWTLIVCKPCYFCLLCWLTCFYLCGKISLYKPGYSITCCIDQAGFELRDLRTSGIKGVHPAPRDMLLYPHFNQTWWFTESRMGAPVSGWCGHKSGFWYISVSADSHCPLTLVLCTLLSTLDFNCIQCSHRVKRASILRAFIHFEINHR